MTAVDTNVVVRILTADDQDQTAASRALFAAGPIWIAKTVLLETGWVLRSAFGLKEPQVCAAIRSLLGLENVVAEDEEAVEAALDLSAHGMGFADAIHLASRPPGAEFATFDETFSRRAKKAGARGIRDLSIRTR